MASLRETYDALVTERRTCRACAGLANASQIGGGAYDVDEVGGYAHWHGRLDAKLAVVAKDFACETGFVASRGLPNPGIATNKNLVKLFEAAGLPLSLPSQPDRERYFFTNAVLCMKSGGMSDRLKVRHIRECAQRFLGRTLELVRPRIVVAGGKAIPAYHPSRLVGGRQRNVEHWRRIATQLRTR